LRRSIELLGLAIAVALSVGLVPTPAYAKPARLRPPPDVDLDPDRGMTFGRMSKITHDQKAFKSFNQATRPGVLDPTIDPYTPLVKNQYDPDNGIVHGSLNDAAKLLRQLEDVERRQGTQLAHELAPQKSTISLKPENAWPPRQKKPPAIVTLPKPAVRPH
jgi:hypothetical protein